MFSSLFSWIYLYIYIYICTYSVEIWENMHASHNRFHLFINKICRKSFEFVCYCCAPNYYTFGGLKEYKLQSAKLEHNFHGQDSGCWWTGSFAQVFTGMQFWCHLRLWSPLRLGVLFQAQAQSCCQDSIIAVTGLKLSALSRCSLFSSMWLSSKCECFLH